MNRNTRSACSSAAARGCSGPPGGGFGELGKRAADQARDLHLRDPDALADLLLREVFIKAKLQHATFAFCENQTELIDRGALLDAQESCVLDADRVLPCRVAVVVP